MGVQVFIGIRIIKIGIHNKPKSAFFWLHNNQTCFILLALVLEILVFFDQK
jgi:hypothetical protein